MSEDAGAKKTNGADDDGMMDADEDAKGNSGTGGDGMPSEDDDDDSDEHEVSSHYYDQNNNPYFYFESQFELAIVLDTIKVPLQKQDEFAKFSQAVKDLSQRRPTEIEMIVSHLTPDQKDMLKKLLKTIRIVVGPGNQATPVTAGNGQPSEINQVPREIIKGKRRNNN